MRIQKISFLFFCQKKNCISVKKHQKLKKKLKRKKSKFKIGLSLNKLIGYNALYKIRSTVKSAAPNLQNAEKGLLRYSCSGAATVVVVVVVLHTFQIWSRCRKVTIVVVSACTAKPWRETEERLYSLDQYIRYTKRAPTFATFSAPQAYSFSPSISPVSTHCRHPFCTPALYLPVL